MRNPWSHSPSTEASNPTEHNMQKGLVRAVVSRSLAVPAGARTPLPPHNNVIPKPWQRRVHTSLHVNAPQPLGFQLGGALAGQHGVVAVLVLREDRVVVASHAGSLA